MPAIPSHVVRHTSYLPLSSSGMYLPEFLSGPARVFQSSQVPESFKRNNELIPVKHVTRNGVSGTSFRQASYHARIPDGNHDVVIEKYPYELKTNEPKNENKKNITNLFISMKNIKIFPLTHIQENRKDTYAYQTALTIRNFTPFNNDVHVFSNAILKMPEENQSILCNYHELINRESDKTAIRLFSITTIELDNHQDKQSKNKIISKSTPVIEKISNVITSKNNLFIIGSWQSGDFIHVYAGIIAKLKEGTINPINLLVIVVESDDTKKIKKEIEVTLKEVCHNEKKAAISIFITDPMTKECGITVLRKIGENYNAITPYDATLVSSALVKNINPGNTLIPEWGQSPGDDSDYHVIYKGACEQFQQEYLSKVTSSNNRASFVCIWDRTSGRPSEKLPLGGANPQYDSSETGNRQLCEAIKLNNQDLTAIFTIGTDFSQETKNLDYVFNLGKFWEKMGKTDSRFEQNRFFYYMTTYYNCDVVHVGMKSGGMDTLGTLGQNVIFIDSDSAPHITRKRVDAWESANMQAVHVTQLPTAIGKAIGNFWRQVSEETKKIIFPGETERKTKSDEEKKSKFGTTMTKTKLQHISAVVKNEELTDGLEKGDLERISNTVGVMLKKSRERNMVNQRQQCTLS